MCVKNLKKKEKKQEKNRRANCATKAFESRRERKEERRRNRRTKGEREREKASKSTGCYKTIPKELLLSGTLIVAEIYFRSPRIYLTSLESDVLMWSHSR